VPAEEIIHLFVKERPTQSRGIPWVATAILKLRMLGAYEEAEVIAARVASAKMGFFIENLEGVEYTGAVDESGNIISEVEPGILEKLPPGVDFKPFDPGNPSAEFSDFVKAMLRGISAGLGCNYNTLCNDLESVNYSSLRAGALEEREYWMDIQSWFIDAFLERLYPVWVQMSALSGKIKIPYEEIDRYIVPEWQPRRWDWVDPLKDVQAKIMELKNGLTTRTRICAEQGIDFEDILEEIKRERQLMDKYGVTIQDIDKNTALITEENEEVLTGGNNGNQGK
jgi:lambda family phage portal protein